MFVVAITGGIGSGKSTVAEMFHALGVTVFDADVEARALANKGTPAFDEIVATFGATILDANGDLNRAKLRDMIFKDSAAKRRLENILHPRVKASLRAKIGALAPSPDTYCIVVIPLLFEAQHTDLADRILVVDAPEELQISRTSARSGLAREDVRAIMAAQWSRDRRLAGADDVIYNEADSEQLRAQVAALDANYRKLAAKGLPRRPKS